MSPSHYFKTKGPSFLPHIWNIALMIAVSMLVFWFDLFCNTIFHNSPLGSRVLIVKHFFLFMYFYAHKFKKRYKKRLIEPILQTLFLVISLSEMHGTTYVSRDNSREDVFWGKSLIAASVAVFYDLIVRCHVPWTRIINDKLGLSH